MSASLDPEIAVATYLRMNRGHSQFGTLNDGLRVRMLTGWVHDHRERKEQGKRGP